MLSAGCSALATYHNLSAARGLERAREVQAEPWAPYEMTLADAYLDKAREEASQAHYQDAVRYAKRSQEMSARAVVQARVRGHEGVE